MTSRQLLLTTAVAGILACGQVYAQGAGGAAPSTPTNPAVGKATGGAPGQRIANEQAQGPGAQIFVSPADTRIIQQALNKAGYDVGNVDGQWNKQTEAAAKNFQQANGLEPSGTLTVRTVMALGIPQVLSPPTSQGAGQGKGGLPGQRIAQETTTGPGTPLYISPASTRQIQQALNKAGYSVGNVNGQWDKQTEAAAKNFQQAQGLEPNGRLDLAVINKLGLNQQIFHPSIGGGQMAQGGAGGGAGGAPAGKAAGGLPGQRVAQEQATGPGTPLFASPATVREITQALNKAGYEAGNVDANWKDQTAQAAKNFQQAKGLEPTGTLTTATLSGLGMTNWMQGGGGSPTSTGAIGGGAAGGGAAGGAGRMGAPAAGATGGGAAPSGPAGASAGGSNQMITITPRQ